MFLLFAGIDVASNWNMYLHVALGMLICFFVLGVFLVSAVLISLAIKYAEPRLNSLRSYWWFKRNWKDCL